MSITNDSVKQTPELYALGSKQKNGEEETKSFIGFVGTHKDVTSSETVDYLNTQLASLVDNQTQEKCHVSVLGTRQKYLYAVDNTISGSNEDSEVNEIRKQIEKVTDGMSYFLVPITWMILEIQVKSFCQSNSKPYISLEEFSAIAGKEASIKSKDDVDSVL